MPIEQIRNYVALTERIGTAGQPRRDEFALVAAAGYEIVVNLAMPDHEESIADEGSLVTGSGMAYVHLPVPWDAPTPGHLLRFCRVLSAVHDQRVFVHCIMNYRVSAFMYHYLTKIDALSPDQALSPIFDTWTPDGAWARLMLWTDEEIGL